MAKERKRASVAPRPIAIRLPPSTDRCDGARERPLPTGYRGALSSAMNCFIAGESTLVRV